MTQIAIFEQFTGLTVERQIKAVIGMGRDKFDQLARFFLQAMPPFNKNACKIKK